MSSDDDHVADEQVPTVHDFSPASIAKALKRHVANHWTFKYPITLFLGGILFGVLLNFTELLFMGLILMLGVAAFSYVFNNFILVGQFERRYVAKLKDALDRATERKRGKLDIDLIEENYAEGADQLKRLRRKFDNLVEILSDKLDPREMTYNRYYSLAKEVLMSGIDNLSAILVALKSISEIDEAGLRRRISRLKNSKDDDAETEAQTLQRRLDKHGQQLKKVKRLRLENEKAMTRLDEAAAAISDMDSVRGEAEVDMENSMKMLKEMVERAKEYSL